MNTTGKNVMTRQVLRVAACHASAGMAVCRLAIKTHQCTVLDAALGSEKNWTIFFF